MDSYYDVQIRDGKQSWRLYRRDARTLMLVSKSELLSAARSYIASSRIIMYGLCLVLLFMGSMNYFHVIVTGYTVRKEEFSVMQSIGMTTRQLKKMTRMEGSFYGLIVGVLVHDSGKRSARCCCRGDEKPGWLFQICVPVEGTDRCTADPRRTLRGDSGRGIPADAEEPGN